MNSSLHLVCPHCAAVNRIPGEKIADQPHCGRCKSLLLEGKPIAVDGEQFERHLTRDELPLLVDFWAPWCGPCRMMAPVFEQAARDLASRVRLLKVDTEAQPALAQRHAIRSIPTLALFVGGREIARQAGALDRATLLRWVDAQLART